MAWGLQAITPGIQESGKVEPFVRAVDVLSGYVRDAGRHFEESLEFHRRQTGRSDEAYVLSKLGRNDEAREILAELTKFEPHKASSYNMAIIDVGLEEYDEAFDWLKKARTGRDDRMVHLLVDLKLDPIRDDPRFQQLLQDVGWVD